MPALWLTRARLRKSASAAALVPLLAEPGRLDMEHALIWSLFADGPDRRRDFLWRRMEGGLFYFLSNRPPVDSHALFDLDEPKPFAPALSPDDKLRFSLCANPVVRRGTDIPRVSGKGRKIRKHDIVMDAIHGVTDPVDRGTARQRAICDAGFEWLARQGETAGFRVDRGQIVIDGYDEKRVPRPGARAVRFSTLDFEGLLTVTDPVAFDAAIARGFGAARAFGCGLMLIRRA